MTMYLKLLMIGLLLLPFTLAVNIESGLNYYTNFSIAPAFTPEPMYKLQLMTDDIGTSVNTGYIFDYDNDGVDEYLNPDYYGTIEVFNWTSFLEGTREYHSNDYGTLYYSANNMRVATGGDNDADGFLEFIIIDYYNIPYVCEYNGASITCNSYGDYAGNVRSSASWCDSDNDGDLDFAYGDVAGNFRIFHYNGTDYELNDTISGYGDFYYGGSPGCANWSNNASGDNWVVYHNDGQYDLYSFDGSAYSYTRGATLASSWSYPVVGDFLGDGLDYIMLFRSNGNVYAYNGSTLFDAWSGASSFTYGSTEPRVVSEGGKDVAYTADSYGRLWRCELESSSLLTCTMHTDGTRPGGGYCQGDIAWNGTEYAHYFACSRQDYHLPIYHRTGATTWKMQSLNYNLFNRIIGIPDLAYSWSYISGGFSCGNLTNTNGNADECVICSHNGYCFIFTYQNSSEYRLDVHSDYEFNFIDIMPRDALMYYKDGSYYCVNDKRNLLYKCNGQGNVNRWCTATEDDTYATLADEDRVFDGIVHSGTYRFSQDSGADYTTWDSGADQSMYINLTKSIHIGLIKYWAKYNSGENQNDVRIAVSSDYCGTGGSFTTVFNESANDEMGAEWVRPYEAYFVPQDVKCIKITSSGATYDLVSTYATNYVSQVEAYYANDCTFYGISTRLTNTSIGDDLNVSIDVKQNKLEDSPDYFQNGIDTVLSNVVVALNVISKMIITVSQW